MNGDAAVEYLEQDARGGDEGSENVVCAVVEERGGVHFWVENALDEGDGCVVGGGDRVGVDW